MITVTARLDNLETALPALPARIVRLQRAVAGATYDRFSGAVQSIAGATGNVLSTARVSGRTVTGQARASGTDVLATAKRNANQVAGQTRAQGRRVSSKAEREASSVVDAALDAVETTPGQGTPYEQWTKAELLDRAKALDVEGRHGLDKAQLIAALRSV